MVISIDQKEYSFIYTDNEFYIGDVLSSNLHGPYSFRIIIVGYENYETFHKYTYEIIKVIDPRIKIIPGMTFRKEESINMKDSVSLVDIMRPYSDKINYPQELEELWKEELEKCKDFEYWFNNYYTPLSIRKWRQ